MSTNTYTPAPGGEPAIHAAGLAVNATNPTGQAEIRAAIPDARAAALAVKSRSESTGPQVGEFTGLRIALYQNWLYEKNREWHFTDGTLSVLWSVEFPHARSDYAKNHKYIASTRRDYNNGKHQAPPPAAPCVGYNCLEQPMEPVTARGPLPTRVPLPVRAVLSPQSSAGPVPDGTALVAVPPAAVARSVLSTAVSPGSVGDNSSSIVTEPASSASRLQVLEAYMAEHVLGPDGMTCASYIACAQSHRGRFFEGQLHHVGKHFDAFVGGKALRVVVVGQEYGNGPARVTLAERYEDVAVRTGLRKHFRRDGVTDGRNPHMRGTTSLLRLVFGREPGDRHEDEFFDTDTGRVHVYDMFALVNYLLCSAIAAGESEAGSKHGRSTRTMQDNCARHFVRAIEILEPTLVVAQGKGTLQWMASSLRDERHVSDSLRWTRIGQHQTLLATFSHPSAQGPYNWADLSRTYLRDVVAPTIGTARKLLLGV